jgi:hypothetical protein
LLHASISAAEYLFVQIILPIYKWFMLLVPVPTYNTHMARGKVLIGQDLSNLAPK